MIRHMGALATAMSAIAMLAACSTSTSTSATPPTHSASPTHRQTTPTADTPTTASTTSDPSPSTSAKDLVGPVGSRVYTDQFTIRVLKIVQPADAARQEPSYLAGEADAAGALAEAEVCARKSASGSSPFHGYDLFSAVDKSGGHYEQASSAWDTWPPLPQFPGDTTLAPGACAKGWILFTTPAKAKVSGVLLASSADQLVEWTVKK